MMQSFPSAGGRVVWVRDSGDAPMYQIKNQAKTDVSRSQTLTLVNTRQDANGCRWFEFRTNKKSNLRMPFRRAKLA